MRNKIFILLGIIGTFLIFVGFFAGSSIDAIRHITTNLGEVNRQTILLFCGNLLLLAFVINFFLISKKKDVRITSAAMILVLGIQCLIAVYLLFRNGQMNSDLDYRNIITVGKKSLYSVCCTMRYMLTMVTIPILSVLAFFNAPEKANAKKHKFTQISSSVLFCVGAAFLIAVAITCFEGMQQSLVIMSRVNDGTHNITSVASSLTLNNINAISIQQLNLIRDLRVGLTTSGDIIKSNCTYAIILLIGYVLLLGFSIIWQTSLLVEEFQE